MTYKERLMAQAAKRRAKIKRLRSQRFTYKEIGQKMGISAQRAMQIVGEKVPRGQK